MSLATVVVTDGRSSYAGTSKYNGTLENRQKFIKDFVKVCRKHKPLLEYQDINDVLSSKVEKEWLLWREHELGREIQRQKFIPFENKRNIEESKVICEKIDNEMIDELSYEERLNAIQSLKYVNADGYYETKNKYETNKHILNFHGCYFHNCRKCFGGKKTAQFLSAWLSIRLDVMSSILSFLDEHENNQVNEDVTKAWWYMNEELLEDYN